MLFIVVWGSKGVTYTKTSGTFYCPTCGPQNAYRHRCCRRFFTLYWIPLLPLDLAGEYVECSQCKGTYKLDVLDYDPDQQRVAFEAEFARAVKQVLVRMMVADGNVDPSEIEAVTDVYRKVTGSELTKSEVLRLVKESAVVGGSLTAVLQEIAPYLNDQGKRMVVQAAFFIAVSDGRVDPREVELLTSIGAALEMSDAQVREVVDSLMQAA